MGRLVFLSAAVLTLTVGCGDKHVNTGSGGPNAEDISAVDPLVGFYAVTAHTRSGSGRCTDAAAPVVDDAFFRLAPGIGYFDDHASEVINYFGCTGKDTCQQSLNPERSLQDKAEGQWSGHPVIGSSPADAAGKCYLSMMTTTARLEGVRLTLTIRLDTGEVALPGDCMTLDRRHIVPAHAAELRCTELETLIGVKG